MTPTITPEVARLAEEAKPLFKSMVEGYYAKIRAGFEIEKILGWEWDTIAGIGFDHYDESFEIYAPEDCVDAAPTLEQHQAIMALGCHQYWINFADGTERFCQGERKQGNGRWRKYDEGERLERRAALAKQDAAPTSASTVPEWLPIETAPKDGYILCFEDGAMRLKLRHDGQWIEADYPFIRVVGPGWEDHVVGNEAKRMTGGYSLGVAEGCPNPTHWMPLPNPPGACSVTDGEAKK